MTNPKSSKQNPSDKKIKITISLYPDVIAALDRLGKRLLAHNPGLLVRRGTAARVAIIRGLAAYDLAPPPVAPAPPPVIIREGAEATPKKRKGQGKA